MKNQFYNEFSVQELKARLEMGKWISIELGIHFGEINN